MPAELVKFPFSTADLLPLDEAIRFIASTVYAGEDKTNAIKRVRERARYAAYKTRQIKFINKNSSQFVEPRRFFTWAIEKWPELQNVDGLPLEPTMIRT